MTILLCEESNVCMPFLYIITTDLNSYRITIDTEGQGENSETTLGFMKIFCKISSLLTVLYFSFKNWICTSLFCPGAPRKQLFILGFVLFVMINLALFGVYFLTDPALVFECWTNFADERGWHAFFRWKVGIYVIFIEILKGILIERFHFFLIPS